MEIMETEIKLNNLSFFTRTWTFTETTCAIATFVIPYLLLVYWILPQFMRNREPYKLTRTLFIYNVFQVAYSAYGVFHHTRYIYNYGVITTRCATGDELSLVKLAVFPYFLAKHIDLLDTIFFVLRKKYNQVTFLHVFHHSSVVAWMWFLMYIPTDHYMTSGAINNLIHVLMYAYYAIASLGPEYAKYITWKKNLTKFQLIQFFAVLIIFYSQQNYAPCPLPPALYYYSLICVGSYVFLFLNFYLKSYNKKSTVNQKNN